MPTNNQKVAAGARGSTVGGESVRCGQPTRSALQRVAKNRTNRTIAQPGYAQHLQGEQNGNRRLQTPGLDSWSAMQG